MNNELPTKVAIQHELPFWHNTWVYTCCWCDTMFVVFAVMPNEKGEPAGWVDQAGDDVYCPFCGGKQGNRKEDGDE